MKTGLRRGSCILVAFLGVAGLVAAADSKASAIDSIPLPAGLTVETADLVIHGRLEGGAPVLLDLATILAFPAQTFTCVDAWDGKEHKFTGALLSDILARAGIDKSSARITVAARNKYSIPIRRVDYEKFRYILAWKIDDHFFADDPATKNRGRLSIAIDFSKNPELDPEVYKHQLVWQACDILVE